MLQKQFSHILEYDITGESEDGKYKGQKITYTAYPRDHKCFSNLDMKLMNEIEAEFAGTILEILVENESPVQFGQPLFRMNRG